MFHPSSLLFCKNITDISSHVHTFTDGVDYTGGVYTLTFEAGQSSTTLSIPARQDMLNEPTERFTAQLFNAMGADIGSSDTATVDITDNNG